MQKQGIILKSAAITQRSGLNSLALFLLTVPMASVRDEELGLTYVRGEAGRTVLTFTFVQDRPGILNQVTIVLFARGWDIKEAFSKSDIERSIADIFVIKHERGIAFSDELCIEIRNEISMLIENEISCVDYLARMFSNLSIFSHDSYRVSDIRDISPGIARVEVQAVDSPGVLMKITHQLDAVGIDIISFRASSHDGMINDSFDVSWKAGGLIQPADLTFLQDLLNRPVLPASGETS